MNEYIMSDNYSPVHYRRVTARSIGSRKKRKYSRIVLVLLLIAVAGFVYLIFASGILAEDPSELSDQLVLRINSERIADNL
jgi:hypothetical protein